MSDNLPTAVTDNLPAAVTDNLPTAFAARAAQRRPNKYNSAKVLKREFGGVFEVAIRDFKTELMTEVMDFGIFITGDTPPGHPNELFTVRRAIDFRDGTGMYHKAIVNVAGGAFAYATMADAVDAAVEYLTLLNLAGVELLNGMRRAYQRVAGNEPSGFTGFNSDSSGFTLLCTSAKALEGAVTTAEQAEIIRIDFDCAATAKKVLRATAKPVSEAWVNQIFIAANGRPLAPQLR